MPLAILFGLVIALLRAVRRTRKERTERPRGLCAGCAFVHMQYGATGRNTVFCTFGGGVRPVTIDVLYCTDYRGRYVEVRNVPIGFVPEIRGIEAEA